MKNVLLFLAVAIAFSACHKESNSGPDVPTEPNKIIAKSFDHIDTVTLWHMVGSHRTGGKATITKAGVLKITGYTGTGGSYASGTYLIQLLDTNVLHVTVGYIRFNLYQYGPDSVVSKGNSLYLDVTGMQPYYRMDIDAGNMPDYSIVAGDFIDSL